MVICSFILVFTSCGNQNEPNDNVINNSAGSLHQKFTTQQLDTITHLTIKGTIDARDFRIMRDNMPQLSVLDISNAIISEYSGSEGTLDSTLNYPANELPRYAFYNVSTQLSGTSLYSIILPKSITAIGYDAFRSCNKLTSLIIPNSVTSLGNASFAFCSGLTEVTIGSSVSIIEDASFWGCGKLTSIIIPNSVTSMGEGVFAHCSELTKVIIGNSVTKIELFAFGSCSALTSIIIPNSVTSIEQKAFENCSALSSATIGNSVTKIGNWAFGDCTQLTSIYSLSIIPPDLSAAISVFQNVKSASSCILYVPVGTKAVYKTANQWSAFKNIVEM